MSFDFRIEFDKRELANAKRALANATKEQYNAALEALGQEAEDVMADSKKNYVPVDLGTLRSSGRVWPVKATMKEISVEMTYGGAASPYALAVHEHPSNYSPPSWPRRFTSASSRKKKVPGSVVFHPSGRGPKYLETPLKEAAKGMLARIAAEVRRVS